MAEFPVDESEKERLQRLLFCDLRATDAKND
jgi:hypothetical protein